MYKVSSDQIILVAMGLILGERMKSDSLLSMGFHRQHGRENAMLQTPLPERMHLTLLSFLIFSQVAMLSEV